MNRLSKKLMFKNGDGLETPPRNLVQRSLDKHSGSHREKEVGESHVKRGKGMWRRI